MPSDPQRAKPLAELLRPSSFEGLVGHAPLLAPGGILESYRGGARLFSLILYGPPGSSKTTIARLLAAESGAKVMEYTGSNFGVAEIRKAVEATAEARRSLFSGRVVCFVDEIHRLSKVQQDALLAPLEAGAIGIIAATTENPSFTLSRAILSRMFTVALKPLPVPEIVEVLTRAERHLAHPLTAEAATRIAEAVDGDLRTAISLAEVVAEEEPTSQVARIEELVAELAGFKLAIDSDTHYELASALIKSMRAGDDDGAIEYLARTLDLGEDPRFVARRVVIFASEDVGLADPKALMLATAGLQAIEAVGMPEARIILAHLVVYMARAPKSRESYDMLGSAAANIDHSRPIPLNLAGKGGRIAEELAKRGKLHRE